MSKKQREPENYDVHRDEVISDTPDYQQLWQRSLADQENMRKRLEEEKRQFGKFALEGFMEELFPVLTNFYRATEHVPAELADTPWVSGMLHIQNQLTKVLQDHGLEEISPKVGEPFDPHFQEAIASSAEGEVADDHIVQVVNIGFKLHDRVVVPAQVIVKKEQE